MPAEWAPHEATWVAWPSHADLWQENLAPAREAFAALVSAIAEGETAEVLVPDAEQEALARAALPAGERVRFHRVPFGDIWLRDTAPLFLRGTRAARERPCASASTAGAASTCSMTTTASSERIAGIDGRRAFRMPFVLEGGALDVDGEGTSSRPGSASSTRTATGRSTRRRSRGGCGMRSASSGCSGSATGC